MAAEPMAAVVACGRVWPRVAAENTGAQKRPRVAPTAAHPSLLSLSHALLLLPPSDHGSDATAMSPARPARPSVTVRVSGCLPLRCGGRHAYSPG